MYKILGTDNKEYGPVTADQVRQWIAERRLHPQSLAQTEAAPGWKPLASFPEFSSALASAPPPPVTMASPRPGYATAASGNNQLAVWSLVCGIVGLACCQLVSVAALVMGIVSLGQIKANPEQEGRGMAIAGIVLGCIGLAALVVFSIIFAIGGGIQGLGR